MEISKIRAFNEENERIHNKGWDELPGVMEEYWERLSDYIASDIPGAIEFLAHSEDCTLDIFLDWSEVFDDVVRKTQSRGFLDAARKAYERFSDACAEYDIPGIINYAAGGLSKRNA